MTGVEILTTEQVAIAFGFDWVTFCVTSFLLALILGFMFWVLSLEYFDTVGRIVMIIIGAALGVLFGFMIACSSDDGAPIAYETHYKVTISDEVPMNEFLERYEIIDQEGKIFTVREIE